MEIDIELNDITNQIILHLQKICAVMDFFFFQIWEPVMQTLTHYTTYSMWDFFGWFLSIGQKLPRTQTLLDRFKNANTNQSDESMTVWCHRNMHNIQRCWVTSPASNTHSLTSVLWPTVLPQSVYIHYSEMLHQRPNDISIISIPRIGAVYLLVRGLNWQSMHS